MEILKIFFIPCPAWTYIIFFILKTLKIRAERAGRSQHGGAGRIGN